MIRFVSDEIKLEAAAGDTPRRTITAIAAPYDTFARVSDGTEILFKAGALPETGPAPKVFLYHDPTRPVGIVASRVDMGTAMVADLKISSVPDGDLALALAQDGVMAVSVGVNPTKFTYDNEGRMIIEAADWTEISLVPIAAFQESVITKVAAQAEIPQTDPVVVLNEEEEHSEMENEPMEATPAPEAVEAAAVSSAPLYAQPKANFKLPSAGEWISAQLQGGTYAAQFNANIRAAAPDVTTADLDGILPLPIVAPIYSGIQGLRPVVDAIGARAMPQSGKIFIIPKITTHTSIGGPQTQNTTITAGQYVVDDIQVTKDIYGGYVEVSEASIDWSSPEVLNGLLEDMAKKYALATDNAAADALLSGTSQTTGNVATTDPADWLAKIYACANTILANGNYLPDHLFVSGDVFAQLGSLSDTADRPLFPQVGPMNAFGSMDASSREAVVFGLRLVVDTNFAAKTTIVGAAATGAFRCYETQKGAISIDNVSQLSKTIAFRGYFAPKMIDAGQFMKIPQA